MTVDRASGLDRRSGAISVNVIRPASYVLLVETDADRIAVAVRGCGDALPLPTLVSRNGDEAVRILRQIGPPAVLLVALAGGDGLSVVETLRHIDGNAAVIAWAADRDVREYAANRLARSRAKVLGGAFSSDVLRRCIDALLPSAEPPQQTTAPTVHDVDTSSDPEEQNWLHLAERARQRLGVAGAATYAKVRGAAEYRLSVSWTPNTPMPDFPVFLPSALDDVMTSGVPRMWNDLNESKLSSSGAVLRSLAIVPILRGRETSGALCVFDGDADALRHDDLETLSAIAGRSTARASVPALPIDRTAADAIIKKELARLSRDQLALSVILFAITTRTETDLPGAGDVFAGAVRGDDLVVRWTSSEVLVVLAGVGRSVARRVAERIRAVVETRAANGIAVSGAVTELRANDSFEDVIAKAAERLQNTAQDGDPELA